MKDLHVEVRLSTFDIITANEGSDEPYLWVYYLKIDGHNIKEFHPDSSFVTVHSAPGSHGNLGSKSDGMKAGTPPISISQKIGKWETTLDTLGTMLPVTAPYCAVATLIIAIEEDMIPSTATAEEARRELKNELEKQLNAKLRKIIKEQKFSLTNLEGELDIEKLKDAIVSVVSGDVIKNAVLGILLNPLFFIGINTDDFIGYKVVGPYMMKDFLSSMTDKIDFSALLYQSGNAFDGKYKVTGHIRVTDPVQYSQPAAVQSATKREVVGRALNVDGMYISGFKNNKWSGFKKIGEGVFKSSPAAVMSGDGSQIHVFGRGTDDKYWQAYSPDAGNSWTLAWAPVLKGVFTSPPAAAMSADGKSIFLFGKGTDDRIWYAVSGNSGSSWQGFSPIGSGIFLSGPGAACSADGKIISVFGLGTDRRIWMAQSIDGGNTWAIAWAPVPEGELYSAPAVVCSADGKKWVVVARGKDKRFYRVSSINRGINWSAWSVFNSGTFVSSPAVSCNGNKVSVYGIGENLHMYYNLSTDFGATWQNGFTIINNTDTWA